MKLHQLHDSYAKIYVQYEWHVFDFSLSGTSHPYLNHVNLKYKIK